MTATRWSPIEPLDENSIDMDFAEIDGLHRQWLEVKAGVEDSNPQAYDQFNEELFRNWAIETGIIEGLYELDRGITRTLIERGFASEYVERSATNRPPDELIAVLRDHREAIDHIDAWIEESGPLSTWFIQSLHQAITRNQPTYRAVDQFGRSVDTKLNKGHFKLLPNNPTRPDGVVHEYCPPEQVGSELDKLRTLYEIYDGSRHPLAIAAWLHHRFTQIHPFEDGNGRVVRALLTWHLVRKEFLPIVISRDSRSDYIAALEQADSGDLSQFIKLLVKLEKRTLIDALGVDHAPTPSVDTVDEVVGFIVDNYRKRQEVQEDRQLSVQETALGLRQYANEILTGEADRIVRRLSESLEWIVDRQVSMGGPDEGNEHYYRQEVLRTAQDAGHWIDFQEPRFFVRVRLRRNSPPRGPVMVFVVSLHSVGRGRTGVMAVTSFRKDRYPSYPGDGEEDATDPEFAICSVDPFLLTASDNLNSLKPQFETWVRHSFSAAFRGWAEALVEQVTSQESHEGAAER